LNKKLVTNFKIAVFNILLLASYLSNAQGINFQGVSRSANGTILANSNISLRLSLLSKSVDATAEYVETKKVVTNAQGIFSIVIGDGVTSTVGTFKNVNWAEAPKFLKVEMDPSGGTSYINMGITQLQYVPYSFYSLGVAADNVTGVLAVEKGGTGLGSLADLKSALKITTIDTTSLSNRIDSKLTKGDTASLSKRIDASTIGQFIKTDSGKSISGLYIGKSSDFNLANNNNPSNLIIGIGAGTQLVSKPNTSLSGYNNDNNTILGNYAGSSLRASENANGGMAATLNVLVGNYVGQQMGSKSVGNTLIGWEAARFSSAIDWGGKLEGNVAIGGRTLQYAKKANANVVIGDNTFNSSTNVNSNVAVGNNLGYSFLTGDNNVLIGSGSLDSVSSGNKNVIIGSNAISKLSGDANVLIGYNVADSSASSISNKLYIANSSTKTPLIYGEFDNKKVTINGDLTITGKTNLSNDSTIISLKRTIDSLVAALSGRTYARIDSSNLASTNPVIANRFLDSTFLPTINFNGTSTYIQMGATGLLGNRIYGNNFTVETWVKSYKVSDTLQFIYGTGYQWNGNTGSFKLALYRGRITASIGNFSGYNLSTDFPRDSLWHHVVFTHNNVAKVGIIYIDGIEKTRLTNTGTLNMVNGSMGIEGIGSNLDIGNEPPREFFKGSLRKLRVTRGIQYNANFSPSFNYVKGDSTLAFYELNDLGTHIKASDSAYNGTLYNGTWSVLNTTPINLNDSLIAYYPFSGNANDSSRNQNNGVIYGGATLVPDRFGNPNSAYSFNGNGQYILARQSQLNSNYYTISSWIKTNQNYIQYLVLGDSAKATWSCTVNGAYNQFGFFENQGCTELQTNFSSNYNTANTWTNVIYKVSPNQVSCYVNGVLVSNQTTNLLNLTCGPPSLNIGRDIYGLTEYFNGYIDDIRIYNRLLTSAEINYIGTH
jgi:hypothetical protein